MADVTTAGTFIAAVLEEAGYLAQANFLKDFRDFFREAGALLYILGGVGGVVSLVMFGSFRAARYLLLGPAIYWFLIGPTTKYDGVVWQIGGGEPRGLHDARGEAASRQAVNKSLESSGLGNGGKPIEVATGFALFARPINMVARGFVDLILDKDEDKEYLLHISKARALEMLLTVQPEDPAFINMLEGDFVTQCSDMIGYGMARAAFNLRDDVISQMGSAQQNAEARRKFYEDEFAKYRDKTWMNPGISTRAFLRAQLSGPDAENIPFVIDCKQMWKLIGQYLYDQAGPISEKILDIASGDKGDPKLACERLLEKIEPGGNTGGKCNLQNVVALYLLRNSFMDRRSLARFVKRATDNVGEPKAINDGQNIALANTTDPGFLKNAREFAMRRDGQGMGWSGAPMSSMDEFVYVIGRGEIVADNLPEGERQQFRDNVQSIAKTSTIGGPLDAGFMEYPRYHLRNLRQQLFTWSMQLPYWQGVLLYMIAVAYPFMALIVLLPGRAVGFLNVPLAWLWVKSWDVGLAFVMVFERVLWNILPSLEVSKLVTEQKLEQGDLWRALSEAQKFDHTWNLHIYYICLAMATFSIPAVTGYATLKGRRAVLSSFTEKLSSDAKEAGSRAAGGYGVAVMADRVRTITELRGMAYRSVTDKGEGVRANLRGPSADAWATFRATTKAYGSMVGIPASGSDKDATGKAISALAGTTAEFLSTRKDFTLGYAKFDREWIAAFHPVMGRYGQLANMNEAYAAAMDGSGGFELNEHRVSPVDQYAELMQLKVNTMLEAASNVAAVNPVLAGAMFAAEKSDDAFGRVVGIMEKTYLADSIKTINTQLPADERRIAPQTIDAPLYDKVWGLNADTNKVLHDALADPESFRLKYTYRREEAFEDLPKFLADQVQSRASETIRYGVKFSGENKGAEILRDSTPDEKWHSPDAMEQWRKDNPGIGTPLRTPAGEAGGQSAAADTSLGGTLGALDKRERDQREYIAGLHEPLKEHAESDARSHKKKLEAMQMAWLVGTDDENLDEERERRLHNGELDSKLQHAMYRPKGGKGHA